MDISHDGKPVDGFNTNDGIPPLPKLGYDDEGNGHVVTIIKGSDDDDDDDAAVPDTIELLDDKLAMLLPFNEKGVNGGVDDVVEARYDGDDGVGTGVGGNAGLICDDVIAPLPSLNMLRPPLIPSPFVL
jgi:hypothetical protein